MNCDSCAWRKDCKVRKAPGAHRLKCDDYFPDLFGSRRMNERLKRLEKKEVPRE